jgi:SET domain
MASSEDDPFGTFGGSSDDEEGDHEVQETEENRIARSLVNLAKVRTVDDASRQQPTAASEAVAAEVPLKTTPEWDELVLPWSPPLYIGPIKIASSLPFGGGRGCVAERTLPPGTLVMVEEPLASWSVEDNRLDLYALQSLFERENASQIVHDLEHFHPTKRAVDGLEPSDPEQVDKMMIFLRAQNSDDPALPQIIETARARNLTSADGSAITEVDVLRLLLALRYNGLESGIFRYAAMLNHADQPNCVKFLPTQDQTYSEVRTTRAVAQGEALTISYVPRIMSHASRRKHLWEQHRFDIGAELPASIRQMELIGNRLPPSALNKWDEDSTTHRIEMALAELDAMYKDASVVLEDTGSSTDISEQAKALEQASLELCTEAEYQLQNENHLLLLPCRRLHMDSCDLVQRDHSLSLTDRTKLLGRLVVTAHRLLQLQKLLLGPDHFDIARTDLDLAQAIDELLSRSPKLLLALQLEGLTCISVWSCLEYKVRKDYERIKAIYPRDVDDYIIDAKKSKLVV